MFTIDTSTHARTSSLTEQRVKQTTGIHDKDVLRYGYTITSTDEAGEDTVAAAADSEKGGFRPARLGQGVARLRIVSAQCT